ncbi:hypothetical protein [Angustibacter aerolatus]|uniref:Uncharacterized protein n=1 Tax=Angustibacter aerolatus TaxID=1162965 RepID=A0ABQ6JL39_9ACTN|nr:hypothetical protein GCM10025868_27550 [Angustibacter aerolatus]
MSLSFAPDPPPEGAEREADRIIAAEAARRRRGPRPDPSAASVATDEHAAKPAASRQALRLAAATVAGAAAGVSLWALGHLVSVLRRRTTG